MDSPSSYRTRNRGNHGFIMCTCLIFTTFFVAIVVMTLVIHPPAPLFNVTFPSVENFNTMSILTSDWNINIVIENPNDKLREFFSNFKVELVRENDVFAVSLVPNFEMDKKEKKHIDVRVSSNAAYGVSFHKWDMDLMAKKPESGSFMFWLRVDSNTVFKSSLLSTENTLLLVACESLKVVFQNNTRSDTLDNGGKPFNCQLLM